MDMKGLEVACQVTSHVVVHQRQEIEFVPVDVDSEYQQQLGRQREADGDRHGRIGMPGDPAGNAVRSALQRLAHVAHRGVAPPPIALAGYST